MDGGERKPAKGLGHASDSGGAACELVSSISATSAWGSSVVACSSPVGFSSQSQPLMRHGDCRHLMTRRSYRPSKRSARLAHHYGTDSNQIRRTTHSGWHRPHPVVILIHGGCFKAAYGNARTWGDGRCPQSKTESRPGTSNTGARTTGSGWPGTYLDVDGPSTTSRHRG